jgi:hypothetical protein
MRPETAPPTPEEIAAACREIQAEWSPRERDRRCTALRTVRWQVPGARLIDAPARER